MSTVAERITQIKNVLFGGTWEEFAEKFGVPRETLKTSMKRQRATADLIEAVTKKYPQLTGWLLLGEQVDSINQPTLSEYLNREVFNYEKRLIVQSLDARLVEDIYVKSRYMKKIRFIQSPKDKTKLGCLIDIDWPSINSEYNGQSIWLQTGNMSFESNRGGGYRALFNFREWLNEENPALVKSSEILLMNDNEIDRVFISGEIRFGPIEMHQDFTFRKEIYDRFLKWREGKEWM